MINPGTGFVEGATLKNALDDMKQLIIDAECPEAKIIRDISNDEEGRYGFIIRGKNDVKVSMPGVSLEKVRYRGEPGQDIWDFPRMYVDGSSWIWLFAEKIIKYAVNAMREND